MKNTKKYLTALVVLVAISFYMPTMIKGSEDESGIILGSLYFDDGTTPITGAVVNIQNATSGKKYQSTTSDADGLFEIMGVESGIYLYSLTTPDGDFVADDIIGLKMKANETAKISINLTPYENKASYESKGYLPAEPIEGETFIGRVVGFDTQTKMAEVFVMQADLQPKDKIHTLGEKTDFYQKVDTLKSENSEVSRVKPGNVATIPFESSADIGDAVFVANKKSILPSLFLPVGVAAVAAGSSAVAYNLGMEVQETNDSPSGFKTDGKKGKK